MTDRKKSRSKFHNSTVCICIALCLCLLIGLFLPVQTSVSAATVPLDGLLTMSMVKESSEAGSSNGYKAITSTELEIGDEFLLGINFDQSKLGTTNINIETFEKFEAYFDYSTEYYEVVTQGDITDTDGEDGMSRYVRQYEETALGNKLTYSVKSPSLADNPDGIILVIRLKVKKAIDDEKEDTLKLETITVNGVDNSGAAVDCSSGSDVVTAKVKNSVFGSRKLLVQSTYGQDMGNLYATVGKDISIPVYVENNTGFNGLKIYVSYDSNQLECTGMTLSPEFHAFADIYDKEIQNIGTSAYAWAQTVSLHDVKLKAGKKLLDFNFSVLSPSTALLPTSQPVTITVKSVKNESGTTMSGCSYTVEDGSALVSPAVNQLSRSVTIMAANPLGDVNLDHEITLVDAAYLLQYYNGVRELTPEQIKLGDINSDGVITLLDVLRIMIRYNRGDDTWDI